MTTPRASAFSLAVLVIASSALAGAERDTLRQLTTDPTQEGFPCWSPDGTTIVFARIDDEFGKMGLWTVPGKGGTPVRLTDYIGEHPSWSSDGAYIVFDADRGNSIKLIAAHGGTPVRIVPESVPIFRGGNPKWSPDATRVAFKEGSRLWVLTVSTGELTTVFDSPGRRPIPGCWSADGEGVYVWLRADEGPQSSIWMISTTGGEHRQLTFGEESVYRYMDLSPDGSLLAFVQCEGRNCDLWIMPPDGGTAVQITSYPGYDDTPRWSPDGTTIAFTSARGGSFDIWTIDVDVDEIRAELRALNDEERVHG